jgi:hypothetical protein
MRQNIADRDLHLTTAAAEDDHFVSSQRRANENAFALARWREATTNNQLQEANDRYNVAIAENDAWLWQRQQSRLMALDLARRPGYLYR